MSIRLLSKRQMKKDWIDVLSTLNKKNSVRRAFITRSIKQVRERLAAVTEAVYREHATGWYLGEKYTIWHVQMYKNEIAILQELYKNIDQI